MSHRNEPNGKTPSRLHAPAVDVQAVLREALDAEFEVWMDDNGWQPLDAKPSGPSGPSVGRGFRPGRTARASHPTGSAVPASFPDLPALLDRSVSAGEPQMATAAGSQILLVLPLELDQNPAGAAVGIVRDTDPDVVRRLARSALRTLNATRQVRRQEQQLGAYARQLSQSFEELAWLRVLAGQIEYCDASSQLAAVAAKLLPSLCHVLGAQSLALIRPAGDVSAADGTANVTEVSCKVGDATFGDEAYDRLVRCFAAEAKGRPFVCNDLDEYAACQDAGPLRACMLVHVAKNDRSYGWLVAVNKLPGEWQGGQQPGLRQHRKSECEFGTIEAGLMESASVMLAAHARNAELFRESESLFIGVIRALAGAIDAKDPYTCGHSDRVARIAKRLARELGLDPSECEQVYLAGLLHDIGKIGIRDDILLKPGRLTDHEFEEIKKHPVIGFAILRHVQHLQHALPGVLHHHERIDGRGYPGELAGTETPLPARIIAVADAYDAMTSSRPYRTAMPFEEAEAILRENRGVQWDTRVVDAFFAVLREIHDICADSAESCLDTLTIGHVSSAPPARGTGEYVDAYAAPASVPASTTYLPVDGG